MWFLKFQKACDMYGFSFTLSNLSYGLRLELEPNFTIQTIVLKEENVHYKKLFKRAIKSMKKYSKTHST